MGIDRALAGFGAGKQFGFPCLVIDAGTALTFTAIDPQKQFFGVVPFYRGFSHNFGFYQRILRLYP